MLSRSSMPLLALILFGLSTLFTLPQLVSARTSLQELSQQPIDTEFKPTPEQKARYYAEGGNDLVHEIWSILRKSEPTWKESVINTTPSGITGTTWHYTKIVLKALFMNSPTRNDEAATSTLRGELKNAVETFNIGADFEDKDAIFLLAELNFYGNFSHPRNFSEAFKWYERLANLDGNSTAQHMLGLMYATGVGDTVERDQAKALLYHTFAAEQGEVKSEMTLAYRYHAGIGTLRDCNKAADYYKRVADKAMKWWQAGPPGGQMMQRNAVRWIEYEGGAYGEGASVSSSGHLAYKDGTVSASFDDVLEFLYLRERQGDWNAVLTLGKHYYEAPRGYRRNLRKAQRQFMKITRAYWMKDGKVNPKAPKNIDQTAGKAAAYIGRMFLRGEGMEQNFEKAITWFRRGISNGDAFAQYHLGLMYRDGLGLPKDGIKAATYFKAASEQSLAIAQSALGVLFLDQGDVDTAWKYFELAASAGIMEGFYYLAELTGKGVGRERNCGLSVAYYKVVSEKAELLHSSFMEANAAFDRGDLDRAFLASLAAAEQGYENAQANVALLLDEKTSVISLPPIPLLSNPLSPISTFGVKRSKLLSNPALALVYFTRSSKQANVDSLIKMGDYYLSGSGRKVLTSSTPEEPSSESDRDTKDIASDAATASICYSIAAESHHSAQALWNMGWMHENGIGPVSQDFHMAKRYYDLALEMNKEAYLPVKLALLKLRARSWWNSISGGNINGIKDDKEKTKGPKTFMEWLNRFLDAAEEMDAAEYAELLRQQENGGAGDLDIDGVGGYGDTGMPGGDSDYYYHNNNNQDAGVEGDYLDGDFDDGLFESLAIVLLAGALVALVWARQQRQRADRAQGRVEGVLRDRANANVNVNGNVNADGGEAGADAGANVGIVPAQDQVQPEAQQQQQQPDFIRDHLGQLDWGVGGIGH